MKRYQVLYIPSGFTESIEATHVKFEGGWASFYGQQGELVLAVPYPNVSWIRLERPAA